ncbi:MAG: hypothetical protein ACTSRE_13555 [Promethearchaeota archaeon]
MSFTKDEEFRKCPFCGYIMSKPYPEVCPNPTCLNKIDDISKESFTRNIEAQNIRANIERKYELTDTGVSSDKPRDIKNIEVSHASAAEKIKGVKKKKKTGIADLKQDVIVIPSMGQYFKNIGVVTENRDPIFNKNEEFVYLQELSVNLDAIASIIIGGEIDRLMLLSDISNATEKVLYIKKDGLIYFLYGQFPDKHGYLILNDLRRELSSIFGGRKFDQLSPVELHNLKRSFPSKVNFVLEQYTKAATDIITDRQIPSVVDSIRFDYFGMSYQSIGTISKILGDDLLDLQPGEDTATAIDIKESAITAKIEAIAAITIANTKATPKYLTVKLGYQKFRYLIFEKLPNDYFIYMLAEGNLEKYDTVAEILKEIAEPYTRKTFRGDLRPFIELRKQIADFFQIRTF